LSFDIYPAQAQEVRRTQLYTERKKRKQNLNKIFNNKFVTSNFTYNEFILRH